jgi:hypothetical protein
MVMDAGELARGKADVDLVLAGVVFARARHGQRRGQDRGRSTLPALAGTVVFASKNPACSPLCLV